MRLTERMPSNKSNSQNHFVWWEIGTFAILVGVMSTFMQGYYYGLVNHLEQVPPVMKLMDPTLFQSDFCINSEIAYCPRFFYFRFLAALGRVASLPVIFLILTCVANAATALVTYCASKKLFPNCRYTPILACAIVMSVHSINLGEHAFLHHSALLPGLLVMAACLFAVWQGLCGRPLACALFACAALVFHPMVGFQAGVIGLLTCTLSVALRLDSNQSSSRGRALAALYKVGPSAALLIGVMLVMWIIPISGNAIASEDFIFILAHYRLPHHLLPSSFPLAHYLETAAFAAAFAFSWKRWYQHDDTDKRLALRFLLPPCIIAAMCVADVVLVEVFPTRIGVMAYAFRMLSFAKWFGLMLFARTIVSLTSSDASLGVSGGRKPEEVSAGFFMLISSGQAHAFGILWAQTGEALLGRLGVSISVFVKRFALAAVALIAVMLIVALGSVRESLTLIAILTVATCFFVLSKRPLRVLVSLCFTAAVVFVLSKGLLQRTPIVHLTDVQYVGTRLIDEVAEYAKDHTDRDSLFLGPSMFARFRLMSERSLVVDYKIMPLREADLMEWYRRVKDCYGETSRKGMKALPELNTNYANMPEAQLIRVAQKYHADYAVMFADTPSKLPVLFSNIAYKVVRIPKKTTGI